MLSIISLPWLFQVVSTHLKSIIKLIVQYVFLILIIVHLWVNKILVVVVVYINYMLPNPLPFLKAFHTYRYITTTCTFHRTIPP